MRASREQVAENRKALLEAASRLFRERGFDAVTVTDVMKSAGLTHGGFYGYFKSKADLMAEALSDSFQRSDPPQGALVDRARDYLSPRHRDDLARGCSIAALASDAIRQEPEIRAAMTAGLKGQIERLTALAPGADPVEKRRAAIGTWAAMVGALILSRTSDDPALADEILEETGTWLSERE